MCYFKSNDPDSKYITSKKNCHKKHPEMCLKHYPENCDVKEGHEFFKQLQKKIVGHFQILKGPLVLQGGSGLKSHCKICRLSDSQVFSKLHNDEQSSKLQTQHYSIISLAFFFVAGGKAINR